MVTLRESDTEPEKWEGASRQTEAAERQHRQTHALEEEEPKGRAIRMSQRLEGRGQMNRRCNLEVRPEAEGQGQRAAYSCLMPGSEAPGSPQKALEPSTTPMTTEAAGVKSTSQVPGSVKHRPFLCLIDELLVIHQDPSPAALPLGSLL